MKFDLASLSGKTINSARLWLRIDLAVDAVSAGSQTLKSVSGDSWDPCAITHNSRPAVGTAQSTGSGGTTGQWVYFDVTSYTGAQKGGIMSLAIDTLSTDGKDYNSTEESGASPYLEITSGTSVPTVTRTPTKIPTRTPTPGACTSQRVDIILALDRSSSMGSTKLAYEKNAAKAFVDVMNRQSSTFKQHVRLGAVSWAGRWTNVKTIWPTYTYSSVTSFINNISTVSTDVMTCIECAINKASQIMTDSTRKRYVVLMSDGIANRIVSSYSCGGTTGFCGNPTPPACVTRFSSTVGLHCPKADSAAIAAATNYKGKGVVFHAVGYGSKTTPSILESTLKGIAGTNYIYGGSSTNWDNVFRQIAVKICPETKSAAGL